MKRSIRRMSAAGDSTVAEWETETVSDERLKEIETEFNEMMKRGYIAADITDKRDTIIHRFDPAADILMIPRVQGGR